MIDELDTEENDGAVTEDEHLEDPSSVEPYGKLNADLPAELVTAIKALLSDFSKEEMFDRRREVLRDRRLRFYERGYQHIYENGNAGTYSMGQPGQMVSVGDKSVQTPNYINDYNIFFPYQRSLTAVLTQNPPGVDFRALDSNKGEDLEASDTAESYRHYFDIANDRPKLQQKIVRMYMVSSRCVTWTRTEADEEKWGFGEDGSPKHKEVTNVYGTCESKVSIVAKEFCDSQYCVLFDDQDYRKMRKEYPDFRDEIKPGTASIVENSYERIARLGLLHGTRTSAQVGDSYLHISTRAHCFLRPGAFESDKFDAEMKEGGQTLRELANQVFPSGCCFVLVGDTYVGSWDQNLDDCLHCSFPYEEDGMFRMAMMDPMAVIQDTFNDWMNTSREVWDYSWPSTWAPEDYVDFEAITSQKADPYAFRQLKNAPPNGTATKDLFYREPNAELPTTFMQSIDNLQQLGQFITGSQPALFGGAQVGGSKTASEAAQMRSQAMGMLGMPWSNIQKHFAEIYRQAALAASNNPDYGQGITVPVKGATSLQLQIEKLTKGNWGCYADEDSSFPDSTESKRALLQQIVQMAAGNPVGEAIMQSPDNWEAFLSINGMPELTIPQAEARNKQVRELELLMEQSPLMPSPEDVQNMMMQHAQATMVAQQTAGTPGAPPMPPPMPDIAALLQPDPQTGEPSIDSMMTLSQMGLLKPSIPVGDLDFHQFEAEEAIEFLSSMAAWRAVGEGKRVQLLNVELHAKAHQAIAQQQAMQAAQMQAAAKPKETINFADESPAGKEQMNKQVGINAPGGDQPPGQEPANKGQSQPKNKPPGAGGQTV